MQFRKRKDLYKLFVLSLLGEKSLATDILDICDLIGEILSLPHKAYSFINVQRKYFLMNEQDMRNCSYIESKFFSIFF